MILYIRLSTGMPPFENVYLVCVGFPMIQKKIKNLNNHFVTIFG